MAVVQMQKVAVVAHKSKQDELLTLLQEEGVLEIVNMREPTTGEHPSMHFKTAELDFAIQTLTEHADKETIAAAKARISVQEIEKTVAKTDVREVINQLHALDLEESALRQQLNQIAHGTDRTTATPAPDVNMAEEPAYFGKSKVHEDLSHYGVTMFHSQAATHNPEAIALEKKEIEKRLIHTHKRRSELATELPSLVRVRRYIAWMDQKQAAKDALMATKHTVTLFGWIQSKMFQKLERRLQQQVGTTALLRVKADDGETPPVTLENPTWLTPFESVTKLYGLPLHSEMDPTPLLAAFFLLFFGLCLTDAGYGLVLAIVMGGYLLKTRKRVREAPLWWLLFIGGIATILISIPFGGWFGMSPAEAPAFLVERRADGLLWFKGQIWNLGDRQGVTFFQNLALALGLIHLVFGMLIAAYIKWADGQRAAAIWLNVTGPLLIVAGLLQFFAPNTPALADYAPYASYVTYAMLALFIWGQGHGSKWYSRPLKGILGLLNFAMGMLGNTLSYLRLLALGLVTGALAMAVNLVAVQISALAPKPLNYILLIAILLVGHTMNIALNVLGAFIHSGRLQFVEFFSQFFEGGGREFRPFSRTA